MSITRSWENLVSISRKQLVLFWELKKISDGVLRKQLLLSKEHNKTIMHSLLANTANPFQDAAHISTAVYKSVWSFPCLFLSVSVWRVSLRHLIVKNSIVTVCRMWELVAYGGVCFDFPRFPTVWHREARGRFSCGRNTTTASTCLQFKTLSFKKAHRLLLSAVA